MIRYNDALRCLSNAPTSENFFRRLGNVLRLARLVLTPQGRIAALIGGYSDGGRYQPLPHLTVACAAQHGLRMACIEIIRLQYGNTSLRKEYRYNFIPGLHDQCLAFAHDR